MAIEHCLYKLIKSDSYSYFLRSLFSKGIKMKKFLTILLLLLAAPSFADWDLVGTAENGTPSSYIDLDQIRKEGGFIHFWNLSDLKQPDSDGDLSYLTFVLGDCKSFRLMYLIGYYYKKNMGEGASSGSIYGKPSEWDSPTTGTMDELMLNKVCDL